MAKSLQDKVIIVTGAGRGIGREIALLCAAEGAKVVVNDPGVASDGAGASAAPAEEVVEEIKTRGGTAVPSPSPRSSRGEGWGEGLHRCIRSRGESPSPEIRYCEFRPLPASGAR